MGGHVPEDILGLDLEEAVGVEELATIHVLPLELVVVEVVHQVLGEIRMLIPTNTGRLSTRRLLWTCIVPKS